MTYPTIYTFADNHLQLDFSIVNPDGTPYDLTGVQNITYGIAVNPGASAFVTKSLGSGISITAPATAGLFTVDISQGDTARISGCFFQQAQIRNSSGNQSVCYAGYIVFQPNFL